MAPTIAGTAYRSRSQRSSEGTSSARTSRSTPPPTAVARPRAADGVRPRPYSYAFVVPATQNRPSSARVEDVDRDLDVLHLWVKEEHQQGGEQRGAEVAEVGERGRGYGPDDHVAEQPSAQCGDLGEDGDAEDVEVLADGQQGAGDREDEDPHEVEHMLDGGGEQFLKHPDILTRRGARALQRKAYRVGFPVVNSQVRKRSSKPSSRDPRRGG